MSLLQVASVAFGMQAVGFAISAPLQTERYYDLTGSLTFAACVGVSLFGNKRGLGGLTYAFKHLHSRQIVLSAMTLLWCARLGSFLFYRVQKDGKDRRFDKLKKSPIQFAGAWFMQGLWVFITAYPVYFVNVSPAATLAKWALMDGVGLSLWAFGFLIEAVSDYQKLAWAERIGKEARKVSFIQEGLWAYSRHPNYLGEITLWTGVFLVSASSLRQFPIRALSFGLSPLLLSGIPLLEKSSDKRFGHMPAYVHYKNEVPELIPRLTAFKPKKE